MAEILLFPGVTRLPIEPDRVLESVLGKLDEAIVVGTNKGGDFYFASSVPSGPEALWLLERAKHKLMTVTDDLEEEDE
jgi:hypothetical protein